MKKFSFAKIEDFNPRFSFPAAWGNAACQVPFPEGGDGQSVIDQTIASAQTKLADLTASDPAGAYPAFLGWLTAQFVPGGEFDFKSQYTAGWTNTFDYVAARKFGNYDFGAVLAALGFSAQLTLDATGVAQVGICIAKVAASGGADNSSCGEGVPLLIFPFGDQATDQYDIQRAWAHFQNMAYGICP